MSRPKLLDLYAGAGGAAKGYQRAGFHVTGIDNRPQPNYCGDAFHQADALEFLAKHGSDFAVIHSSPPCQRYTLGKHIHQSGERHPDLVAPTRKLLEKTGRPWVIENVPQAPLHRPVVLCGLMFGLRVLRHRLFESNLALLAPAHRKHPKGNLTNSKSGYSTDAYPFITCAGHNFVRTAGMAAMGIDWHMTREEVANAVPPAFAEYIGRQLLRVCQREAVA